MSEAAGMFGQSEEPTRPMRVKIHLIIECVAEAAPNACNITEEELRVAAMMALGRAIDESSDGYGSAQWEFRFSKGKAYLRFPKVITNQDQLAMIRDEGASIGGAKIAFKGPEFCEREGRIDG